MKTEIYQMIEDMAGIIDDIKYDEESCKANMIELKILMDAKYRKPKVGEVWAHGEDKYIIGESVWSGMAWDHSLINIKSWRTYKPNLDLTFVAESIYDVKK